MPVDRSPKGRMAGTLLIGDRRILEFIYNKISCRILDFLMPYITNLGGAKFTILTAIAVFLFIDYKLGLEMGLSLGISHLIVHVVKRITNRPRPYITLKNIDQVNIPFEPYSFPSGHTTAAFSVAVTLSLSTPIWGWECILLALASLVGISRVYLGVHYPSDVLMGGLLGTACAYLVHFGIFV